MSASGPIAGHHEFGHFLFMGLGSAILVWGIVVTVIRRPPNGAANLLCGLALWLLMVARFVAFVVDNDQFALFVLFSAEVVLATGILLYKPARSEGELAGVLRQSGAFRTAAAVLQIGALVFLVVLAVVALSAFGAFEAQGFAPCVLVPALGTVPIILAALVQVLRLAAR